MDREILRTLFTSKRNLTGNQIAKKVNLSPSAIRPRLNNLRNKKIIKDMETAGMRTFKRKFGSKSVRIRAPRSISWGIDLKKPRKRKK